MLTATVVHVVLIGLFIVRKQNKTKFSYNTNEFFVIFHIPIFRELVVPLLLLFSVNFNLSEHDSEWRSIYLRDGEE